MTITEPGIYDNVTADTYHGQLTDTPSLSSSMARAISEACPAKMWWDSYLNPDREREEKAAFDIGKSAHLMFLEPHLFSAQMVVVDADDFRTKAAQIARDDAYAAGKTPLLPKHVEMLGSMRSLLLSDPVAGAAFEDGKGEQTFVARCPETGVWLKARPDWRPHHGRWLVDYKTTTDASPEAVSKAIWEHRYFQQAPWYSMVVALVTGEAPPPVWFIFQEKTAPYLLTVHVIDPIDLLSGDDLNRQAIRTFANCLETQRWPSYSDRPLVTRLPHWARMRLTDADDSSVNARPIAPINPALIGA